jgi:hypothetical protein
MSVKVQTKTGENFVSSRLKIGDSVQVTEGFAHYNPKCIYVGKVGILQVADDSEIPFQVYYRDIAKSHWFRKDELILAPPEFQSIDSIKHTILEIMDGKVFYTEDGTKIHMQDGILKYGEALLNLEKLVGTPLTSGYPKSPPFEIDPIKGTHCEVWNFPDDDREYALIIGYLDTAAHKFAANNLTYWRHAKPV